MSPFPLPFVLMLIDERRETNAILEYARPRFSRPLVRWAWVLAAIAVSVALLFAGNRLLSAWNGRGSNAPWSYASDVGAHGSLWGIREAVVKYRRANSGSLPVNLSDVEPFILSRGPSRPVTPQKLLPHVILVPRDGTQSQFPIGGGGDFLLMVHVLGAGPMPFDRTLVLAEDGYSTSYRDAEVIAAFGKQQYDQLKSRAFQLP